MNIKQQSEIYIHQLTSRKRNPAKPSTLNSYNCYLRRWIVPKIGQMDLKDFENGAMKDFIVQLDEYGLSPATIAGIQNCVKGIVSSAVDENGNEIYSRKWNTGFIDAPPVVAEEQKAPTITSDKLHNAILKAGSPFGHLLAFLAGSGLRVGEMQALKVGRQDKSSYWDPDESKLVVRMTIYRGKEQTTKTPAGNREVDLCNSLNDLLKGLGRKDGEWLFHGCTNGIIRPMTVYEKAKQLEIPPVHSLRRFRLTYLENSGAPMSLVKFWAGHATGDITERYIKSKENVQLRKEWAEKIGLGFTLNELQNTQAV